MSITIKGVTSGGVDLKAPDTGSNTTVTLPSATGTLLPTDGNGSALTNLTSANLVGALPAISGASLTNLPAGGVDGIVSTADATAITINAGEHTAFTGGGSQRYGVYDDVISIKGNDYSYLEVRGTTNQSGLLLNKDDSTGYGVMIDNGGHLKLGPLASINEAGLTFFKDTHGSGGNYNGLRITSDGRGLSQFTAKAWVNWNGRDGNADTINKSHNVSSISYNQTGEWTVNYTNNLNDVYPAISGMAQYNHSSTWAHDGNETRISIAKGYNPSASSVRISAQYGSGLTYTSSSVMTVTIFGT